ncbi:MAG: hypothetical protein BroJett029_40580 [Alphaproteobacteria bacterium]|nr:MAG: hypothetical protein BroJett029_40580 [Alphaproteobacteria bacterium]
MLPGGNREARVSGSVDESLDHSIVIAGLDPAIHPAACVTGAMDARIKSAHDIE